jgi:eukaryotic-like serine/threonine-protein kinase
MVGHTLSHYRIVRPLGAGGMGEVFLAEDTKLGRQVALKVLARDSAHDPDRRARFEREARAIAALNHPGIVTIHSVEEVQGLLFITMELVDGTTLIEHIPSAGMRLDPLLKIAIPLTDAVGTAHQRGITHRDLKPANVMIGHDGRVKVLDFGLAKQQADASFQGETVIAPTADATAEGKILGTVAYMSPEQAEGKPVDQRSDIFSLGIVLFEMATGQRPFKGDSNVSVLSSVLRDTPPLVTDLRPELPREIARIIRHCLAKDPEERYQSAKDLRNDLKALKADSDSGELARRSTAALTSAPGSTGQTAAATAVHLPAPTRRWIRAGLTAGLVLTGALLAAWWMSVPAPPRVTATRQITTDGAEKSPPVSDGARLYFGVSHLRDGRDKGSALAQVSVAGGDTVELAGTSPGILDIDASGAELLVSRESGTGEGALGVMQVLGGVERSVGNVRVNNPRLDGLSASWTPDKSHVIYAQGMELHLAGGDGSGSRVLLTAPGIPSAARMSPDGQWLRYTVRDGKTGTSALWEARADGSNPHPLLPEWRAAQNPCCGTWSADGRYYLFIAERNIWARGEARGSLRRTAGEPVQLTFGPVRFTAVLPSRDGRRLFALGDLQKGHLARYDAGSKQFVEYLGGLSAEGVATSPDGGSIVYTAFPENTLWRSRLDGSGRAQITFPPEFAVLARWSPDGSQIAYTGGRTRELSRIYLVAANGGTPRRATSGNERELDPTWSPDGQRLAFGTSAGAQVASTVRTVQVLDLRTGQVTTLPGSQGFFSPRWSPDGRFIVATSLDAHRLVIFDVATRQWTDLVPPGRYGFPNWTPDGTAVIFRSAASDEIAIKRVTIADRRVETIVDTTGLNQATGFWGTWVGLAADGSPMVLLDAGTHDIYALDWDAP